ncbi:hypothetical protein ACHAW6_004211 [Cyclotella cf. meneghiniana]
MGNDLSQIDDADFVGAFSKDWNYYVQLLSDILDYLYENSFTINPLKCQWAIRKTDWLGYWLTNKISSLGKRKSKSSCTWIVLAMPLNCACSLDASTISTTCGPVALIYSNHSGYMLQYLGQMKCSKPLIKCVGSWLPMLLGSNQITTKLLTFTQTHLTSNLMHAFYKKEGHWPTSLASCQSHKLYSNGERNAHYCSDLEEFQDMLLCSDLHVFNDNKTYCSTL